MGRVWGGGGHGRKRSWEGFLGSGGEGSGSVFAVGCCGRLWVIVEEDVGRELEFGLSMMGLISDALALLDRTTPSPLAEDGVGGTLDCDSSKAW
jgi:hypothetical protein